VSLQAFSRPFTVMNCRGIGDHHAAIAQRRRELRLNVGVKGRAGERPIDYLWCTLLVATQPSEKGMSFPASEGSFHAQPLVLAAAPGQAGHFVIDVRLVQKH
jgi:hypothetical protein